MSALEFVHLHPTGMNPSTMEKRALAEAIGSWLCADCGAPRPSIGAVDVQIQEEHPSGRSITFVNGCGVVLVHRHLLAVLGTPRVEADLLLGRVLGPSGEAMPDWVTVRGRRRVIIRGSKNVSYRRCGACGRHVYFAMGSRYLFPAPADDAWIHESDLYGLVVAPEVLEGMTSRRWPGLGLERLKVLSSPKDSLGEFSGPP